MSIVNNYIGCLLPSWLLSSECHFVELVGWPGLLASEFWEYARCILLQLVLVAVAAKSLWHICGNGTAAPRKCRLLGLKGPFLCPALDLFSF